MGVEIQERFKNEPILIGVMGDIGVGKSTLLARLSGWCGWDHVEENFPLSPFLKDFYDDPWRWSFHSQVWFLEKKIEQLKNLDPSKSYLIDPAIQMDKLYAKTLAKIGFMNRHEYRTYNDLFEALIQEEHIREPNLYLWIDARQAVIRRRIIKRNRPFEMKMLREYPYYISELRAEVRNFAASKKGANILYVNANHDNFVDDIHINGLALKIARKLNE